jgi:hypothetical protein
MGEIKGCPAEWLVRATTFSTEDALDFDNIRKSCGKAFF